MKNDVIKKYIEVFNTKPDTTFFSPGRVNLIGEHIDYNGGFVMPCALTYGTYGSASLRTDREVHIFSEGFSDEIYTFSLDNLVKDSNNSWADYVKGVIKVLLDRNYNIKTGFNLTILSTMPTNAGLSSSASLESLIVFLLDYFLKFNLSLEDMAIIGMEAENNFVGVNSGIMDQFSIIAGKKDNAILLNTENLKYEYIPIILDDYQLLVINTNKKRGLADSKYNERFSESREALKLLQKNYDVEDLCSIDASELPKIKDLLPPLLYKRTKHIITEQQRTILSKNALTNNNIELFAKYLIESHESLKNDYDVTGIELDTLVEETLKAGATGARMTGAGFGGCIVSIVKKNRLNKIINDVTISYTNKIGYKPSFYIVEPSDGTKVI